MALIRFSQIRGHRSQVESLHRLVARGQPGHAYLFEGPEGVGKDTVAQAFLARLACLDAAPGDLDPCGRCRSCAALNRGEHPDLGRLAKDGATIKIDQVRQALGRLRFDPILGNIKGLVVESADLLREEAANALLKTLEEPSSRTLFLLVSSKPQLMLETIRSRCQVLRFAELSPDDVAALLVAEGQPAEPARVAAALAQGSMVQARVLCNPARLELVDFVAEFALSLGSRPPSDAAGFVEQLGKRLATVAKAASEGDDEAPAEPAAKPTARSDLGRDGLEWAIDVLRAVLRDVVLVAAGMDVRTLPHSRHAAEIAAMAARTDPNRLIGVVDACQRLEDRLGLNPSPRLALESLLVDAGVRLKGS